MAQFHAESEPSGKTPWFAPRSPETGTGYSVIHRNGWIAALCLAVLAGGSLGAGLWLQTGLAIVAGVAGFFFWIAVLLYVVKSRATDWNG